jgi:hypothetical protein
MVAMNHRERVGAAGNSLARKSVLTHRTPAMTRALTWTEETMKLHAQASGPARRMTIGERHTEAQLAWRASIPHAIGRRL